MDEKIKRYAEIAGLTIEAVNPIEIFDSYNHDRESIFQYSVPKLTPDGTCSASNELEKEAFDLRDTFLIQDPSNEKNIENKLSTLYGLLQGVQQELKADWIGIYQTIKKGDDTKALVKLVYFGEPSRAEFPLTTTFAKLSNNSSVGLSGKAKIIDDVNANSGPYYVCDSKVKSEACLPIYDESFDQVIGIIDAESFTTRHFGIRNTSLLAQLCIQLTKHLPIH